MVQIDWCIHESVKNVKKVILLERSDDTINEEVRGIPETYISEYQEAEPW